MSENPLEGTPEVQPGAEGTPTNPEAGEGVELTPEQKLDKAKEIAENQKIRAEKAEKEKKELEDKLKGALEQEGEGSEGENPTTHTLQEKPLTHEEVRIVSKYTAEEFEELKFIADREGISLKDAIDSPRFASFQKAEEDRKEEEAASMRASDGGSTKKDKKTLQTPGLSFDERKKLYEKELKKGFKN